MCCQMGRIGCAILQVAQKAIVRIQFISYFWNQVEMKNVVKCWKDFLSYFTTLETYRGDALTTLVTYLVFPCFLISQTVSDELILIYTIS